MIWNTIAKFADNVIGEPIRQWSHRKTLQTQHKNEIELATHRKQMELIESGQQQDFNLDQLAMQNMQNSWKDEIVLIVFLTPMILAFIPSTSNQALQGFQIIQNMPDWYKGIVIGMVVVIYGMRGLLKVWFNKSIKLTK